MKTVEKKNKSTIVLVTATLIFLLLACYGTVTYADTSTDSQKAYSMIDPFTLRTIVLFSAENNGRNNFVPRPVIRITQRPVVRSCFRPPIVLR